jgi:hypothetical protein
MNAGSDYGFADLLLSYIEEMGGPELREQAEEDLEELDLSELMDQGIESAAELWLDPQSPYHVSDDLEREEEEGEL